MTTLHFEKPFVETDAGRSLTHPKERNDCAVRAIALALGITYGEAYNLATSRGRIAGHGTQDDALRWILGVYAANHGKKMLRHSFPAVKGKKRMNVLEFCKTHPVGTFITRQAGEGDILKETRSGKNEAVEYNGGGFSPFAVPGWECTPEGEDVEVIGNVHQNPDLLNA